VPLLAWACAAPQTTTNGSPDVTILSPSSDTELRAGETFSVVAEVADDGGASSLALDWSIDPDPDVQPNPFFSDGEATLYVDGGLPEGEFTITLSVTDPQGLSDDDDVDLTISENKRPRVVIRHPQDDETYDPDDPLIVEVEVDPRDDRMGDIELIWGGVAEGAADAPSSPPDDGLVIFAIEGLDGGRNQELSITARDPVGAEDSDSVEFDLR
jgi:hypothetical protein